MVICFVILDYPLDYIRNDVIYQGLKMAGAELRFCQSKYLGLRRLFDLVRQYHHIGNHDVLYLGPGDRSRYLVLIFRLLARAPLVWDAYYSLYDSWVGDRRLVRRFGLKAAYYFLLDKLAVRSANLVLLDTTAQIDYFVQTFHESAAKFRRVLVGANLERLQELATSQSTRPEFIDKIVVHFHGNFIPLQGVDCIIRAAARLATEEKIVFNIIGRGQTFPIMEKLATILGLGNIIWQPRLSYRQLASELQRADICLGIFGQTPKAERVIASKIYEALALGKPLVSARTAAIQEILTDGKEIILVPAGDDRALAEAILVLAQDLTKRERVGKAGLERYLELATPQVVGRELYRHLINLVHSYD